MSAGLEVAIGLIENETSIDEVFLGIGDNLPDTLSFEEISAEDKIKAGQTWWTTHSAEVKQIVCKHVTNRDAVNSASRDLVQIAFAAIGAKFGMGIAAYVAALGLRMAAEGWCGQSSNEKPPAI